MTRNASRRVSKLDLLRVKLATVVVAIVLFFASLKIITVYNPGVSTEASVPVPTAQITIVKPDGSDSRVFTPRSRVRAVRPLTRSRGS